jgi:AcrR family transcriptional regulator
MSPALDPTQASVTRANAPRGAASREAILAASVRVVGREGLPAASLGAIAREAGTSKPAVLYHFGSRENLLREMASRSMVYFQARAAEVSQDVGPPNLGVILEDVFRKEHRLTLMAARELMSLGMRDPVVGEMIRSAYERIDATVAATLPDTLADRFTAAYDLTRAVAGFVQIWLCSGDEDPAPYRAGAQRVRERILNGG